MDIPTYDHKVDRQNAFTKVIKSDVSKRMNTYAKGLNGKGWDESKLLEVGDFGKKLYDNILNIESTSSVNFPMCKHMIESVVFIARNGIDYAKQSNNETLNLSQDLVKIHKMALQMSMFVDSNANKFHQNNIGIILNDLPHIQI